MARIAASVMNRYDDEDYEYDDPKWFKNPKILGLILLIIIALGIIYFMFLRPEPNTTPVEAPNAAVESSATALQQILNRKENLPQNEYQAMKDKNKIVPEKVDTINLKKGHINIDMIKAPTYYLVVVTEDGKETINRPTQYSTVEDMTNAVKTYKENVEKNAAYPTKEALESIFTENLTVSQIESKQAQLNDTYTGDILLKSVTNYPHVKADLIKTQTGIFIIIMNVNANANIVSIDKNGNPKEMEPIDSSSVLSPTDTLLKTEHAQTERDAEIYIKNANLEKQTAIDEAFLKTIKTGKKKSDTVTEKTSKDTKDKASKKDEKPVTKAKEFEPSHQKNKNTFDDSNTYATDANFVEVQGKPIGHFVLQNKDIGTNFEKLSAKVLKTADFNTKQKQFEVIDAYINYQYNTHYHKYKKDAFNSLLRDVIIDYEDGTLTTVNNATRTLTLYASATMLEKVYSKKREILEEPSATEDFVYDFARIKHDRYIGSEQLEDDIRTRTISIRKSYNKM